MNFNINSDKTGDYLIALLFLFSGIFAYWDAGSFSSRTALWPRLTSAIVIVISILLLLRPWLPDSLQLFLTEETEIVTVDEEFEEPKVESEPAGPARPISPTVFTVLSISGYILLSYLFGMLWASPVFVATYLRWHKIRPAYVVILSAVSFAIAYGFMKLLYLPIDKGVLFGGL